MIPVDERDSPSGGIEFYMRLRRERPELFAFKTSGDQWQTVHGWMLKHQLVRR